MADALDELNDRLKHYINTHFKDVEGWCNPYVFVALQPLVNLIDASASGKDRGIAEIGVFHGKFFIGLMKMRESPTRHHAFDVFDQQEFNLDYAGSGDLQKLKDNIALSGEDPSAVEYIRGDSMALMDAEVETIRSRVGGFSLFSVDGCHLAQHTINDIRLAIRMTIPEGIILVDDYCNPSWPGVNEGVARMYLFDSPRFIPLCYITNKLFLCHISHHHRYMQHLTTSLAPFAPAITVKRVKHFGYDSLTIT